MVLTIFYKKEHGRTSDGVIVMQRSFLSKITGSDLDFTTEKLVEDFFVTIVF